MRLPAEHRDIFSKPLGMLVSDAVATRTRMLDIVSGYRPLVTVGDRTTERMLEYGILPDVQIVDGMEMRQERVAPGGDTHTIHCSNPPAHITSEALSVIRRGYDMQQPVRILVQGEEDLLMLPALLFAPDGAVLIYGQPHEGLVVVYADAASRSRADILMKLLDGDDETVAV